jgi:hypothetical protein
VSVFQRRWKNVRNEERREHPFLVTDDLKEKVKARILENRRYKITELQEPLFRPDSEE